MINFASDNCDYLTVLICCSDKEHISPIVRKSWLENTFDERQYIEIRTYNYSEDELPNTSESSHSVSRIWAGVFKQLFPEYSLLVTSEEYGIMVAAYMGIQHLAFDTTRTRFPVSATLIRNQLLDYWNYLPVSVKPYYALKVVIIGTESTGKTTLAEDLSRHYHCSKVLEAARDIIDNSNSFTIDDLYTVATEHAKEIEKAATGKHPLIIIDTDINITMSYCRFAFNRELEVSKQIIDVNQANLYLYLNNDVAHFQDGTRLIETERNLLDSSHKQVLAENSIEYVEINGSWDERFEKAVKEVDKLLSQANFL